MHRVHFFQPREHPLDVQSTLTFSKPARLDVLSPQRVQRAMVVGGLGVDGGEGGESWAKVGDLVECEACLCVLGCYERARG